MKFKAIIFDMDGTLLDTLADLAESANRVLAERGYPTHPQEAYKWFVGDGSKILMTRALPKDQRTEQNINACLAELIADYDQHWHTATKPYRGITNLLNTLQKKEIKLSVVTNKPHRFTGVMMNHFFEDIPFCSVLGQQDGIPKKPNPQQALATANKMGVAPSACIFLGDSAVDMETAIKAGMCPIGVGWGFRPIDELIESGAIQIIHHPQELLHIIHA